MSTQSMQGSEAVIMGGPFIGPNTYVLQANVVLSNGETRDISRLVACVPDPIS